MQRQQAMTSSPQQLKCKRNKPKRRRKSNARRLWKKCLKRRHKISITALFNTTRVPQFLVNSLPLMSFLARRDNWDVAMGMGTKFQRFSDKNSISTPGLP